MRYRSRRYRRINRRVRVLFVLFAIVWACLMGLCPLAAIPSAVVLVLAVRWCYRHPVAKKPH